MAAIRFLLLKSVHSPCQKYDCMKFTKYTNQIDVRPSFTCINRNHPTKQPGVSENNFNSDFQMMGLQSFGARSKNVGGLSSLVSNFRLQNYTPLVGISPVLNHRSFSSSSDPRGVDVQASSGSSGSNVSDSFSGSGWFEMFDKVKDVWESTVDVVTQTGQKAKEALDEMTPYVEKLLDTHPYLRDVIVPVGGTVIGTILAWAVMPRILRRFHKYSTQGPAALLSGNSLWGPVPYEKSFWGALEDPVRYLITFMAFSQIAMMVAPTTIASQYIAQSWRAAVILSFVWFLNRWKTNVITRALAVEGVDRHKLLTLDKISSVGLFAIGGMALAEACGVAVQSILTVGGVGGVATAFAARDILGNVLSGLSVQISQPFSLGDTIKAGSVEGQVVEMGLTNTKLLSAERFPVIVPNSLFSSQVIVNKSRAGWRAIVNKIPLQISDLDKIPQISEEIKNMLRSNPNVFLEREPPFCYMSRVEWSYAELTLGCNLKQMGKDKLLSAEQDILLQSVQIIKQHGASLGSRMGDSNASQ